MPIVLKKKTSYSPGIIIFTHNEILRGVPRKSKKVNYLLKKLSQEKKWIFGVHVQGDCSNVFNWPFDEWQDFIMWPDKNQKFLSKIPKENISSLTCINFLSNNIENFKKIERDIDIISITRFSRIKNIEITLSIFKELLNINPQYKLVLIAPKESRPKKIFKNKEHLYLNKIDSLVAEIKNSSKYKNLQFIIHDTGKEGLFPLPEEKIYDYISRSRYLMLNSYREGVPRVLIEALCLNTKVIISNKLKFGLDKYFNTTNLFSYDEKNKNFINIVNDINSEIKNENIFNNSSKIFKNFDENLNKSKLINFLNDICSKKKITLEDENHDSWKLNNLKYRLACHFKEQNHQIINNENLFLMWFKKANEDDNYSDEKYSHLFKQDNFDIILEIKFFIQRLIRFILRKFRIK